MTDDNDQAGASPGVPGDEHALAQLIDRHNDLVQAWEDNEDPDVRAQISFEIRQLDTQINELTEAQVPIAPAEPEQPLYPETEFAAGPESNGTFSPDDTKTTSYIAPEDWAAPDEAPLQPETSSDGLRFDDLIGGAGGRLSAELLDGGNSTEPPPLEPGGGDVGGSLNGRPQPELMDVELHFPAAPPLKQPVNLSRSEPIDLEPPAPQYDFEPGAVFGTDTGPAASGNPQAHAPAPDSTAALAALPSGGNTPKGVSGGGNGNGNGDRGQFVRPSGPVLAVVGVCLALLAGVLWFGNRDQPNETQAEAATTAEADPASPSVGGDASMVLNNVRVVLDGLGLTGVVVDEREGVIHIGGPVPSQADYAAATNAAQTVAGDIPVDSAALVVMGETASSQAAPAAPTDRGEALQLELDRLLAANPLIFGSGQSELTALHERILNNAVLVLAGYPPIEVTIAGFTDDQGDDVSNQGLSLARAENVRAYLVAQGIAPENLAVRADGEQGTSGSEALARLERRVEFEVSGAGVPLVPEGNFRIAIVAPSASNDLAFTQSMVDAVNLLATEVNIELAVTDNTFVPDEAAAAVQSYAEQGYDLVIAHGSQFGAALIEIAPQFPETAFAWGTASDTFGLPNVYAYDAAAQEGGYVLGALASSLSSNKVAGVVGPIEVGDAQQYITGFDAGAKAENPGTDVLISYTGSFSDIALATETAQSHIANGADVLTGSAQMVVGAISATDQQGGLWFGTQANQASLAPTSVVASQVYHWEVALRPILNDIGAGTLAGTTYTANLANGGLVIEYNPDYPLSPEARQRADDLTAAIASGSITPPG